MAVRLLEGSPAKRAPPTARGFLIVVRRSAVLGSWPMFSFHIAFWQVRYGFVGDDCWKRLTPAKKTSVFEHKIDILRPKFSRRRPIKPIRERTNET
jgi:hypothetical protein